jgi:hypothetical protein
VTEPRNPGDPIANAADSAAEPANPSAEPAGGFGAPRTPEPDTSNPTQAWPSLGTPSSPPDAAFGREDLGVIATSPFEPTDSLPSTRVEPVSGAGATDGAAGGAGRGRSRTGLRWALALIGVAVVVAGSALIVSLAGSRPATSVALGYMPASAIGYTEIRLDLPGDQRQKLAAFLAKFPGFKDQTQVQPKIEDVLDRIVRAASKDKQTWTADIAPWFGGQIGLASSLPDASSLGPMLGLGGRAASPGMSGLSGFLAVATITDRAKAEAWLLSLGDPASINKSVYNGADLLTNADTAGGFTACIAITDKVLIAGSEADVKAAVDTNGAGALAQDPAVKAAFATVASDYVMFGVSKTRSTVQAVLKDIATLQPGVFDQTQIDETIVGLLPEWQASTYRFEDDAIVLSAVSPSFAIGYDGTNRASKVLGHIPARTLIYAESHDVGPALTALVGKFRALPETKAAFDQVDKALNLLGGFDAIAGWWGDTAFAVSSLPDGTIGGGLVIQPRDAAAAKRLLTTFDGFLALAGSSGIALRDEDHNGTTVTILDFSGMPGVTTTGLPPGYKAEIAWASSDNVAVIGYGRTFVEAVLDAGPGNSLADDPRFKSLLDRVGADDLGATFVDVAGLRTLVEPLAQSTAPGDAWKRYQTDIKPYLEPLDALIQNVRKDGALDRSTSAFTVR